MRLVVAFDEVNVRNILDSSQPCLKVIVTVRDVKPRLVEEVPIANYQHFCGIYSF